MCRKSDQKYVSRGFTLIELLVVTSIVALLASVVIATLQEARKKGVDASKIRDMHEFTTALQFYYDTHNQYPEHDSTWDIANNAFGWDVGSGINNSRILLRENTDILNYISKTPQDPTEDAGDGYRYHRYSAGSNGCDASKGPFYVLGIVDMVSSPGTHSASPGFSCPGYDWEVNGPGFEWVTGKFERD